MNLKQGQMIKIQSYKHNGSLHRTWLRGLVLESTDERTVVVTNKTWVIEADGRRWFTREPAICFFYPEKWFNIIAMLRKSGIYYYCNLASPSLYDGEALKNIDYDLDVKVYPDGATNILDEDEYALHGELMRYSDDLKIIVERTLQELLGIIQAKQSPFIRDEIEDYFDVYLKVQHKSQE
jgi:uncharacterized protein